MACQAVLETFLTFLKKGVDKMETLCYTCFGSQNGYILKGGKVYEK
jgi:hypothetical protein